MNVSPRIISLETILGWLIRISLVLFPWQTVFIIEEKFLNGVKWEYGTIVWYATEVLLWILLIVTAGWWVESKRKIPKLFFLILPFLVYVWFSSGWTTDPEIAQQAARHLTEAVLFFFLLVYGPLAKEKIAYWLVIGSAVPSLLGLYQFLTQTNVATKFLGIVTQPAFLPGSPVVVGVDTGRWLRATAGFQNPNIFGGYLGITIIFSTVLFRRATTHRVWYLLLTIVASAALFTTQSRSAMLAVLIWLIGLILVSLRERGQKMIPAIVSILSVFTVFSIIYFPLVSTRLRGQTPHETAAIHERISSTHEAWNLIKNHPWRGVGIGNYTAAVYQADPYRPGWDYQPIHTVPLLALTELGIIGLLLGSLILLDAHLRTHLVSFLFLASLPLLLFDHYLYSSYIGLMLLAIFWVFIPTPSPVLPQTSSK